MISQLRARRRTNLRRLMNPKHIAFVGGSHLERVVGLCRDNGYAGQMSVINPRHEALAGITCVASADDLDAAPDAAFVALSNQLTLEAVQALAKRGAGGVICHATGYGETGGEGMEAQNALARAAGEMALIGPNCMGLINAFDNCAMWGEYTPSQPIDDNGVALISQSGAFLYGVLSAERAFPLGYAASVGNQAVIDSADILDAVLDDPRVRAIGIYAEGLRLGADATAVGLETNAGSHFYLVCAGSLSQDGKTLPPKSLIHVAPDEAAPKLQAGPDGACVLAMRLPRPTDRPGSDPSKLGGRSEADYHMRPDVVDGAR